VSRKGGSKRDISDKKKNCGVIARKGREERGKIKIIGRGKFHRKEKRKSSVKGEKHCRIGEKRS